MLNNEVKAILQEQFSKERNYKKVISFFILCVVVGLNGIYFVVKTYKKTLSLNRVKIFS